MKEIVQDGAPGLRELAKPLPEELFGSAKLTSILADMEAALDKEPEGVALAAPQIGVPYRIFIVRKDRALPPPPPAASNAPKNLQGSTLNRGEKEARAEIETYINPEIVKTSRRRAKMDEGCLSVKGVYGTTKRHERVTLRARGADGARFESGKGGIMAQIFEHEIDHLNGILFIDHVERLLRIEHAKPE